MYLELEHMTVMTRARGIEVGILAPADVEYLGQFHPEGAEPLVIGFVSLNRLLAFIAEMTPTTVSVVGASGEDCTDLSQCVLGHDVAQQLQLVWSAPSTKLH